MATNNEIKSCEEVAPQYVYALMCHKTHDEEEFRATTQQYKMIEEMYCFDEDCDQRCSYRHFCFTELGGLDGLDYELLVEEYQLWLSEQRAALKLKNVQLESAIKNAQWREYEKALKPLVQRFVEAKKLPFCKRSDKTRRMVSRAGTEFDVYIDDMSFYSGNEKKPEDIFIEVVSLIGDDPRNRSAFTYGQMEGARKVLKKLMQPELRELKRQKRKMKYIRTCMACSCYSFLKTIQDELNGLAEEMRQAFKSLDQLEEETKACKERVQEEVEALEAVEQVGDVEEVIEQGVEQQDAPPTYEESQAKKVEEVVMDLPYGIEIVKHEDPSFSDDGNRYEEVSTAEWEHVTKVNEDRRSEAEYVSPSDSDSEELPDLDSDNDMCMAHDRPVKECLLLETLQEAEMTRMFSIAALEPRPKEFDESSFEAELHADGFVEKYKAEFIDIDNFVNPDDISSIEGFVSEGEGEQQGEDVTEDMRTMHEISRKRDEEKLKRAERRRQMKEKRRINKARELLESCGYIVSKTGCGDECLCDDCLKKFVEKSFALSAQLIESLEPFSRYQIGGQSFVEYLEKINAGVQDFSDSELPTDRQQSGVEQGNVVEENEAEEVAVVPETCDEQGLVSRMLGVDKVTDIAAQLQEHFKGMNESMKQATDRLPSLMEFLESVKSQIPTAVTAVKEGAESLGDVVVFGKWATSTLMLGTIVIEFADLIRAFSWLRLMKVLVMLCMFMKVEFHTIITWLVKQVQNTYEYCRLKVNNGGEVGREEGFTEAICDSKDEIVMTLSAIATVMFSALFGKLPSWKEIRKYVCESVYGAEGKEQGVEQGSMSEALRQIHFSVAGFKAINTAYEFFSKWIEKFVEWAIGKECKELNVARVFQDKTKEVMDWLDAIEAVDEESVVLEALTNEDIHNQMYRLVDTGREFTKWTLREKVPNNVSFIIRDANKKLMDLTKKIAANRPGQGFRYAPFVVMLDGPSSIAKSNVMHEFSDMFRDQLGIPYYNSVYSVPTTAKYLDGYTSQTLIEWDDCMQCPDQDSLVAEFINWRSNADFKPNMAQAEEKGKIHFLSKAITITTNLSLIHI